MCGKWARKKNRKERGQGIMMGIKKQLLGMERAVEEERSIKGWVKMERKKWRNGGKETNRNIYKREKKLYK